MITEAAYLHNRSPAAGDSIHSWRNVLHTGHNINGFSFSAAIAKCVLNGQDKRKTEYIESSMLRLPILATYQKHLPSYLTVKPESQDLALFCVLVE